MLLLDVLNCGYVEVNSDRTDSSGVDLTNSTTTERSEIHDARKKYISGESMPGHMTVIC